MNAENQEQTTSFTSEYFEEEGTDDETETSNQVSSIVPEANYKFEELRVLCKAWVEDL